MLTLQTDVQKCRTRHSHEYPRVLLRHVCTQRPWRTLLVHIGALFLRKRPVQNHVQERSDGTWSGTGRRPPLLAHRVGEVLDDGDRVASWQNLLSE